MRLINADALKKDIDTEWLTPQTKMAFFKIIDNAPTVDTFTFDDMKKGINVGYKAGRLSEKWERPHGEWIDICTLPIIRKCSICGNEIGNEMGFYNNFCPKCGADMRKGGAE